MHGLSEWGGPAHATEQLAIAMGLKDVDDLHVQARRLSKAITDSTPLDAPDWTRALVALDAGNKGWGSEAQF